MRFPTPTIFDLTHFHLPQGGVKICHSRGASLKQVWSIGKKKFEPFKLHSRPFPLLIVTLSRTCGHLTSRTWTHETDMFLLAITHAPSYCRGPPSLGGKWTLLRSTGELCFGGRSTSC